MKHRWHKEIKAWADGAEIEQYHSILGWIAFDGHRDHFFEANEYRIKPQPVEVVATGQSFRFKEKKYLYVYNKGSLNKFDFYCSLNELSGMDARTHQYIGKFKLEVPDD